jgi:Ca-activated chloride channel family protein
MTGWLPDWSAFHFIRPLWLLLAAGAALIVLGARLREGLARRRLSDDIEPHLLEHLLISPGHRTWFRPAPIAALAVAVAAVGVAGPTWREEPPPFTEDKAPLVIVVESSWTMNAIDIQPTRLERAKSKIRALLKARAGARTALVTYAGTAHIVMPFTDDAAAIELFLPGLDPSIMPVDGDKAADALAVADAMLAKETVPGSILLITDGVPRDQFQAITSASRRDLLVLGVGTSAGGPIRAGENRFRTTATGAREIARLDKAGLEALRDATGAFVATATVDDRDITRIQLSVERHMQAVEASRKEARWKDMGYLLVFPVLALGAVMFRRGWTIRWALVLAIAPAAPPDLGAQAPATEPAPATRGFRFIDLWLTHDQQGRRAFERGDFASAAGLFTDPLWKGLACYRAGNLQCAADAWGTIESPEANYNRGNALARLGEYKLALAAYDQALAARPHFSDAASNRALVASAMRKPAPEEGTEEAPDLPPDKIVFDDKGKKGKRGTVQVPDGRALMADAWLKSVRAGPGEFLRLRFAQEAAGKR